MSGIILEHSVVTNNLLGEIAPAQEISPIATHFSIAWSVCLSFVTRVHPA